MANLLTYALPRVDDDISNVILIPKFKLTKNGKIPAPVLKRLQAMEQCPWNWDDDESLE